MIYLHFMQVNTIDFANIFANFADLLAAAPTVFSTVLVLLFIYLMLGIWVRRMDKKDVEKVRLSS